MQLNNFSITLFSRIIRSRYVMKVDRTNCRPRRAELFNITIRKTTRYDAHSAGVSFETFYASFMEDTFLLHPAKRSCRATRVASTTRIQNTRTTSSLTPISILVKIFEDNRRFGLYRGVIARTAHLHVAHTRNLSRLFTRPDAAKNR